MNDYFDKIYVLSLKRNVDRRALITERLNKVGIIAKFSEIRFLATLVKVFEEVCFFSILNFFQSTVAFIPLDCATANRSNLIQYS